MQVPRGYGSQAGAAYRDSLAEAAGFEPLHLEIRSAELHRANGELGRRSASETLF
jgi:hypothetical protein